MPTRFEINADKQAADNEWQRQDTARAVHDAATYTTKFERQEAERIALYNALKVRGNLGMYYLQYPMDKGTRVFYRSQQNCGSQQNEDEYER